MVIAFNIEHKERGLNRIPLMLSVENEAKPLSAIFRNPTIITDICEALSGLGYNKLDMVRWRVNVVVFDEGKYYTHSFKLKGVREWTNVWIS